MAMKGAAWLCRVWHGYVGCGVAMKCAVWLWKGAAWLSRVRHGYVLGCGMAMW